MDLNAGFAPSTAYKMQKSLAVLRLWVSEVAELEFETIMSESRGAALALRAFGMYLYEQGAPRYMFVYAITAVQDLYPRHRNHLTEAWVIDKKWQRAERGACRAVLPVAAACCFVHSDPLELAEMGGLGHHWFLGDVTSYGIGAADPQRFDFSFGHDGK